MWASTRSVFLVPDRADLQFVLGDPKRPFRLGQLDVTFPQRGRIGLVQVRPQQVAALRQRRPVAPASVARPGDAQPSFPLRRREALDLHLERPGRPPVLAHQPAQPPVGHRLVLQPSALGRRLHLLAAPLPADRRTARASPFPSRGDRRCGPARTSRLRPAPAPAAPPRPPGLRASPCGSDTPRTAAASPWACPRCTGRRAPAGTSGSPR